MVVSVFFVVFAIGLLRRFLYLILDPLAFAPNTFYTRYLFNMAFSKSWFTHMLRFKPKPWFEQKPCFWLLHEIYEIAIMIIIAWHVSIGALWRLSQACCLGFPLSSKGLTASGLQLVSAFNKRDVSHRSTEECRRCESCEQERNCQYIPIRRNIFWAEARSLSQVATHSSPQKRKVRRYLPFKWCTGKLMEASYFAPMPHKFIGTYWNRTDPNNIPQYFKKDFLLQVFHLYTMHRRFLRYLKSRQGHCAEERSRCQAACKSRNASCPRCTGSVATLLAWQLDENKSSSVWASWLVAGSQENRDSVNGNFFLSIHEADFRNGVRPRMSQCNLRAKLKLPLMISHDHH